MTPEVLFYGGYTEAYTCFQVWDITKNQNPVSFNGVILYWPWNTNTIDNMQTISQLKQDHMLACQGDIFRDQNIFICHKIDYSE